MAATAATNPAAAAAASNPTTAAASTTTSAVPDMMQQQQQAAAAGGGNVHYASASLYVGDLIPDVEEATLYDIFNAVGPVSSIRVCRDANTHKSLGYAYVNYHTVQDAERALDALNYTNVKGTPCRIMWSHRDPSLRRSGNGNVFVKNLDKMVDNKALYDTFSLFGNILSCKVATDEMGKSLGYGFVHYETDQAAREAIAKVNGMEIGKKAVFVGPFQKRAERGDNRNEYFTNLYVKHLPAEWDEEILRGVFAKYGSITSTAINCDQRNRRFAFVNFDSRESARQAVQELHNRRTKADGMMTREEEEAQKREEEEQKKKEEQQDEEKEGASQEGEAANEDSTAAAATEEGNESNTAKATDTADASGAASGGASTPSSPAKVLLADVSEDCLYVQRAMTRQERMHKLKDAFAASAAQARSGGSGDSRNYAVNLYVKNLQEDVDDEALQETFTQFGTVTSARVMRHDNGTSKGFGFVCFAFPEDATKAVSAMHLKVFKGKPLYVGLAERKESRSARLQQRYRMGGSRMIQQHHQQGGPMMAPSPTAGPPSGYGAAAAPPMFYSQMAPTMGRPAPAGYPWRQPPPTAAAARGPAPFPAVPGPTGAAFPWGPTAAAARGVAPPAAQNRRNFAEGLASAHPQMQKQMLGEKLFPLVAKFQPELAGKITGMMLEMENAELLSLLENEQHLRAKVDEALTVLQRHNAGDINQQA